MASPHPPLTDLSWMIGGPQGSGVDSSASLFAKTCANAGYWVYGKREYHSNIKGEHSYFQVRSAVQPVYSHTDPVHILATFEDSTAQLHADELAPNGVLLYDPDVTTPDTLPRPVLGGQSLYCPLPYNTLLGQIATQTGKTPTQLVILKNTMAVAASLAIAGVPLVALEQTLSQTFTNDKAKLLAVNLLAAQLAYTAITDTPALQATLEAFSYRLATPTNPPAVGSRLVLNGAIATALGKVRAGCRMQTYYSITPAVDECIYLEDNPEFGTIVFQCEDELAAINMAVGAATTGVRASTSTSGPGFSLMAEGLGWAGINEVPVVVFNYQRGGPSTGLPTRHEQSDMLFSLFAGHGEFPRLVLAPGDAEQAYYDAFDAFNWAERYQTPVIVLTDKAMANNTHSIPVFDDTALRIDRGVWRPAKPITEAEANPKQNTQFERFALTTPGVPQGLSPRSAPGEANAIFWLTGDEHTELGHVTEDPTLRIAMHTKRMDKLALALAEIPPHKQWLLWAMGANHSLQTLDQLPANTPANALLVLTWGSTVGPVKDAIRVLQAQGLTVYCLQLKLLWPFPSVAVTALLQQAQHQGLKTVGVEMNYTSQLGQLITLQTGQHVGHTIRKFTGRPMSQTELVDAFTKLSDTDQATSDTILTHGK
jgi:2-oxoglutarate/2-oxoacid ferredoxin oxidoreductase subunit alpha